MRNLGVIVLISTGILGVLTILAGIQENWTLFIVLAVGLHMLTIGSMVAYFRYSARLARTQERKLLRALQSTNAFMQDSSANILTLKKQSKELQKSLSKVSRAQADIQSTSLNAANEQFARIESVSRILAQSSANHVRATVQHGVNEVEALLQIFSTVKGLDFPMPRTGGWAIDAQGLSHILAEVMEKRPLRILELGSGTSTIWLGYLCKTYGGELLSLDHLELYLNRTENALEQHELTENVMTRFAPLNETGVPRK